MRGELALARGEALLEGGLLALGDGEAVHGDEDIAVNQRLAVGGHGPPT